MLIQYSTVSILLVCTMENPQIKLCFRSESSRNIKVLNFYNFNSNYAELKTTYRQGRKVKVVISYFNHMLEKVNSY